MRTDIDNLGGAGAYIEKPFQQVVTVISDGTIRVRCTTSNAGEYYRYTLADGV